MSDTLPVSTPPGPVPVPPAGQGGPKPRRWSSWLVIGVCGITIACAGGSLMLGTCLTAMASARHSGSNQLFALFQGGLAAVAVGTLAMLLGLVGGIVSHAVKGSRDRRR